MRKLSQKELIHEGFGSFVRGLGRVAGQAARGTAKTLLPKTTSILGKGAELAAGAIENIRSGSPVASVKRFLGGEEGRRTFKNIKLGKEELLPNGDYRVPITGGFFINDLGGGKFEDKDVSGGFMIVRQKERPGGAGFDNKILEVHDKNGKLNKKTISAGLSSPSDKNGKLNIKFYDELRDWKIKNIGPKAANVGINGHQMKKFLKSLGVKDPDRVIADRAGLDRDKYNRIVSNDPVATIETVLKSRGIATENN